MFAGVLEIELLLGDVHSLKEKRSVVRPIVPVTSRLRGKLGLKPMSRSVLITTRLPSIKETASRARVPASRVRELVDLADDTFRTKRGNANAFRSAQLEFKALISFGDWGFR